MCVADEEISKTETKRSDDLAEKNFLRDSQLRELENKLKYNIRPNNPLKNIANEIIITFLLFL